MFITEDELIQEIETAMSRTPTNETGAMTTEQLVHKLGISEKKVRRILRTLIDDEKVEKINIYRKTISGNLSPIPAYILKKSITA